ncbi:MAG: dipeptide epimerase [Bacteroidetes bacterium]|nr:dipeptide epimerase [Bacteroidota bacterium]
MILSKVEYFELELEMASGYTIAYETISHAKNVVLKLTTNTGLVGWGCAAPDQEITHETSQTVINNLEQHIIPMLQGQDPFQLALFNKKLRDTGIKMPSAMAMTNIALHDLLARKAQLPLYKLMGGFRNKIATSITIGIMPLNDTLALGKEYWQQGFKIIKLKGGIEVNEDIEKIFKLKEELGFELILRFDANQGYTVEDSIKFIEATKQAEIELFEQPTAFDNLQALKQVTNRVSVPVMADESIRSLSDVYHLSKHDASDMINIKIMKVGGLTEAAHINSVAKAAGMEVMVGCLDECALGISAGLHFALSRPNVEFADLDGHLDFTNDPFKNLFQLKDGWLYPSEHDGLGKVDF